MIVGGENQGEVIPDIGEGKGELPTLPQDDPEQKEEEPPRDGNVNADGEMISGIFVSDNVGFCAEKCRLVCGDPERDG